MARTLDASRPYGAHLRLIWWKPLLLVPGVLVTFLVTQVVFHAATALIDGREQVFTPAGTPLIQLANNLSVAVTALLAIAVTARLAAVPWPHLLSHGRRFDLRRLGAYLAVSAMLVCAGVGVTALLAPGSTGWTGFGITGTTIVLLAVTILTIPLQAAGEELIFRGVIMPAFASWARAVRPALVLGVAGSSILFAVVHGSTDPWLLAYFTVVGLSTAAMAVISGGLEAPIAFHVANNVITSAMNALLSGGEAPSFDRGAGAGGPSYAILMGVNVAVVAVVWWRERSRAERAS